MIYLINLSDIRIPLLTSEFVDPIASIVSRVGKPYTILHYTSPAVNKIRGNPVILCGTALKDNAFLEATDRFSWLMRCGSPILGICAGMQILVLVSGGSTVPSLEVGMHTIHLEKADEISGDIRNFNAYELHQFGPVPQDFVVIARSEKTIQMIRHQSLPWYGVIFHPEVRNEWVVVNFLKWSEEIYSSSQR